MCSNDSKSNIASGCYRLGLSRRAIDISCQYWAVIAPEDSKWASEAVCRQVAMYEWCLVIVFEEEPSETYDTQWFIGEGGNKVVVVITPLEAK